MQAKITVLYDEGSLPDTTLIGAKGSSFIIEADGERTMFGTGLRTRYLQTNMSAMDVSADDLDRVVISHMDKDEWGAVGAVLKDRTKSIAVYAPSDAWGEKKSFGCTGIYFPEEYKDRGIRQDIEGWIKFSEHVYVSPPIPYTSGRKMGRECVMVVRGSLGPIIISHCCHPGMEAVFDAVEKKFERTPIGYIGGLHVGRKNDPLVDSACKVLMDNKVPYVYLNHCAGPTGIGRARFNLGLEGVHDFYAGESAQFDLL